MIAQFIVSSEDGSGLRCLLLCIRLVSIEGKQGLVYLLSPGASISSRAQDIQERQKPWRKYNHISSHGPAPPWLRDYTQVPLSLNFIICKIK